MSATNLTVIPEICERHLQKLARLWARRQGALRDPRYTLAQFAEIEKDIALQMEGILSAGEHVLPILEEHLQSEEAWMVFASAFSLLHLESPNCGEQVYDAFSSAAGPRLEALCPALCHSPIQTIQGRIVELFRSGPANVAVAAGEALAFHSALRADDERIARLLADDSAGVRVGGWRLVGGLGTSLQPELYGSAMEDEPAVRRAALAAGAWCGEPGVLRVGRTLAQSPSPGDLDALELLAILGQPEDLKLMRAIGRSNDLGPDRYRLLGFYGHPALVELLLEGMRDTDAATANAAGEAFRKITGLDVRSNGRATLTPASSGDEEVRRTRRVVTSPDAERARSYWDSAESRFARTARLCRGLDLSRGLGPEGYATLDMESRWEVCLRARYAGGWNGSPLSLEAFPQQRD